MGKQIITTYYARFTTSHRIEHLILLLSFTILAITGIPQKFVGQGWSEGMIRLMGGIETVRVIHRISAIVLMLECVFHVVAVGYRILVLRFGMSILPVPRDLIDLLNDIRYNLGLTKQRPKMGRYTYGEKVEYWAVVWGTLIMVFTGFILWNPIATARFLPGDVIPAAKAAHGGEAILAILSIIIWHMYNVHIKHFNRSIFTGNMTAEEMKHEHPQELEAFESGMVAQMPAEPVRQGREQTYIPVAAVLSLVLLFGLYQFVTFEQTAITTIPRRAAVVAYVPATPTLTPTAMPQPPKPQETTPPSASVASTVPHEIEGREDCLVCHAVDSRVKPAPEDHEGRSNNICQACHKVVQSPTTTAELPTETPAPVSSETPASQPSPTTEVEVVAAEPPKITHPLSGREQCINCHTVETGMVPAPEDHEDLTDDFCLFCHVPAEGESAVPPLPEKAETGFCLGCHGPYEELAALTAGYVIDEGIEGNPHIYTPHESTNITSCDSCHTVHLLPVTSPDEIPQADVQYCYLACHHTEEFSPCITCHED